MQHRRGFSLIEVLVVIGIMSLLMAILLPSIEGVRHRAYITDCASNLRQIGQYLTMYANDNHGAYPRTRYQPGLPPVYGTGAASVDPFQTAGPSVNDVTAAAFLLMRVEHIPPVILNCPYDDVHQFQPEPADPATHSNFTNYRKNFGYSFANPYPTAQVAAAGYKWGAGVRAEVPVAADVNPGNLEPGDDVFDAKPNSPWRIMEHANSTNHERDGQNVLFGDGHVTWEKTPFCGIADDNIYTTRAGLIDAAPADKDDTILLPTDD